MKNRSAFLRTRFAISSPSRVAAPGILSGPLLRRARFALPAVAVVAGVMFAFGPVTRAANTTDNVTDTTANTQLDAAGSYSAGLPTVTSDVVFTFGTAYAGSFTLNTAPISIGTLNDFNATALTITGSQSITLNGGGDQAAIAPTVTNNIAALNRTNSADLLYVAPGGSLTLNGTGGIVLATSGNFDIAASLFFGTSNTGAATINSVISDGGNTLGFSKTGLGTLTLTAANTYTGATNVVQGNLTLNFAATGAPATNIINAGSALTLGGYTTSGGGSLFAPTSRRNCRLC